MALLDDNEKRRQVKEFVRAGGLYNDCYLVVGYTNKSSFYSYLKAHPDFKKELDTIKYYSDPSLDSELIKGTYDALIKYIKVGNYKYYETYGSDGKLKTRTVQKTGTPKWVYEKIHPELNYTEAALKMILSSLMLFISKDETLTDDQRTAFFVVLSKFKTSELVALINKGKAINDE